ncbi:hypothetical protein HOY80DRAFT_996724 [Tuber brumale]|nr:hypothetical protein HOY80DRAFT_996724 [Tuber brumale]
MHSLGHQLQDDIAAKGLRRELTLKLQSTDKLYNATDREKLSEACVVDGGALMALRDARLEKDKKIKPAYTAPATPDLLVIDSEEISTDASEPVDLRDSDWASVIVVTSTLPSTYLLTTYLSPDSPSTSSTNMTLWTHKSPIN